MDSLQQLLENASDEDNLTFIQEKLAAAYLCWGVLQHEATMEDKSAASVDEEGEEENGAVEENRNHYVRKSCVILFFIKHGNLLSYFTGYIVTSTFHDNSFIKAKQILLL